MYFCVEYGVALVTKQMCPESVEINEIRITDYRCLPQVGESEGSFPSIS